MDVPRSACCRAVHCCCSWCCWRTWGAAVLAEHGFRRAHFPGTTSCRTEVRLPAQCPKGARVAMETAIADGCLSCDRIPTSNRRRINYLKHTAQSRMYGCLFDPNITRHVCFSGRAGPSASVQCTIRSCRGGSHCANRYETAARNSSKQNAVSALTVLLVGPHRDIRCQLQWQYNPKACVSRH